MNRWAASGASDPTPEEEAISTRLVSLTARPRLEKRARPWQPHLIALVFSGYRIAVQNALGSAAPMSTFEPTMLKRV
jgi:hypothetical protein